MPHGGRHNLCANPALGVDLTGWADPGGTVGNLVRVTSINPDFPRPEAAELPGGSFIRSARAAISPGTQYTATIFVETDVDVAAAGDTEMFIDWWHSDGSNMPGTSLGQQSYTAGTVSRVGGPATSPSNAAEAGVLIETGGNTMRVTAVLIEPTDVINAYRDGDDPGWEWDGTPELSASRESTALVTVAPAGVPSTRAVGPARLAPGPVAVSPAAVAPSATTGPVTLHQPGGAPEPGTLPAADPLPSVLDWLATHPSLTWIAGVGGLNEPPYPRVRIVDTGGDDRQLRWLLAVQLRVEALGDLDGAPGKQRLRQVCYLALAALAELPDQPTAAGAPVITAVESTAGGGWAPLPTGQPRYLAGVRVYTHPPRP